MIKRLKKNEKGQALVEMALVLPIFLLLIFGIMEFGRIFGTQLLLTNSAREGARFAAVGAGDTQIITRVQNTSSILDSTKMTINIIPAEGVRIRGNAVKVEINYPVQIYAPLISDIVGNTYTASGQAVMRME